jgi:hypothetical protein
MEKKHLFVVIAIFIVAFGVYAYYYHPTKTDNATSNVVQLANLSNGNDKSSPSTLRMSLIREMVANYRQTQLKSNAVENDASSILFDLDTLKKFIGDIERAVKQNQPNENPKLAIRMYYAAYPLKEKWSEPGYKNLKGLLGDKITELYERKHTLILLPVIKNSKGIYADFNPMDKDTYQGFKKKMNTGSQLLKDPSEDEEEVPALNHGQLIPPASNEGEEFP